MTSGLFSRHRERRDEQRWAGKSACRRRGELQIAAHGFHAFEQRKEVARHCDCLLYTAQETRNNQSMFYDVDWTTNARELQNFIYY